MKKAILILATFVLTFSIQAQVTTPQPSPLSKVEQKVGLTDVTIEYSRPGVKGRKIFGGLEAFDKMWRTGANKNTIITFSDPVTINEYKLKAGSYAIFAKPGESMWEVYFYSDTNNWGTPEKWDESQVAAIAKVKVEPIPFTVETFTIDINNIQTGGATLEMLWENTYIGVPFTVPTDSKVLASINDALNGSPKASDYYASAAYYYSEGKDIKQAKEWIDKAMSMMDEPAFYQLRQQSLIYAKAGDTKGAIELAKKSMEASKEAGNMQYVKFNEESLKEWGAN
ncbi:MULTISPECIES: DUF2911 domain-containing protein [Bizionia]|uniref:DUF2911 domain-containing protein n=1 Tax=Bizionia algoritergicola TaxID=291187 RepID=A0A5D0QWN9_9FLAO|nr:MULTISPECIES: DUF2911 domain-containing protein [Bizionia]OBX21292.1 dihydrolipoamide dehydrogenase [Bizionia sp. APA-3]TYB73279.1 DUF2911 domain-containing protein [Bizionia algoritergicola]